jgi:AraC-like DNA-binding protein
MKYLDYRENRKHGSFRFPVAWYGENPRTPRYLMTFHWHKEYEIVRVLKGTFPLSLGGYLYHISAGECIIIPSGVIHGGTPQDCWYECVLFDPAILEVGSNHISTPLLQRIISREEIPELFVWPAGSMIASIAGHLSEIMTSRPPGYELAAQGYFYLIFSELIRSEVLVPAEKEKLNPSGKSVKKVLDYISEHYVEQIRLEDMASLAGMNPNYFCGLFKSFTGQSPLSYLNYYRIECASEMLAARDITIPEAAEQCGFRDVGYFTRCFKKQKGMTPSKYMKQSF